MHHNESIIGDIGLWVSCLPLHHDICGSFAEKKNQVKISVSYDMHVCVCACVYAYDVAAGYVGSTDETNLHYYYKLDRPPPLFHANQ